MRLHAIDKIRAGNQESAVESNISLTTPVLKRGALFVLGATMDDDSYSLSFDGLKRVAGTSKLGPFLYIPMLFHEGARVRKEQRLLLQLQGLLLSRYQARAPARGIVWHGRDHQATSVRLGSDMRKATWILDDLKRMRDAEAAPTLVLNEHCQICEFRQRCGHVPYSG